MDNGLIIVGLDVGTTKISAIAGKVTDDNGIEIIGVGTSTSKGVRKGIVVNIEEVVESIYEAVKQLERNASIDVNSVYVGIAGGHIKSFESYGAVGVKGSEITSGEIDKALEAAKAVYVPLDREVLHVIPKEYVVDGENGIVNPLGMNGVRLEVKVQIVTGAVSAIQNLLKCCEKAKLEVVDIVLAPLACSLAILNEQEKQQGVILIDIGGGTTDIAFYKNGVLTFTSVISIGGNHITNDIAIGLRIPVDEAEKVKKKYASLFFQKELQEELKIKVAGKEEQIIPRTYITEIVSPRCEEIFELIKREIEGGGVYDEASYGVVLTGGGSQLDGIEKMAETVLNLPVRKGLPSNVNISKDLKEVLEDAKYSTSIGLLIYGANAEEIPPISYSDIFNIFKRIKKWTKEIFFPFIKNKDKD